MCFEHNFAVCQNTKIMKSEKVKFILLFILNSLLISPAVLAQTIKLQGSLIDKNNRSVGFANVLLLSATDSLLVDAQISNDGGKFNFEAESGNYVLKISFLGFKELTYPISLRVDTNLGKLLLEEDAVSLGEVTIVATRPVITREIDRIIFDASSSTTATGGSALELLQDVPGVIVGHNSIDIIGKGSIKVFINDRETKLSGQELISYLRSYSSDLIGVVEIITTPPAKYDAGGNAGIINIRLKAKRKDYVGGNLSSSYNLSEVDSYGYSGLNLNVNKNRLSAFINTSGNYGHFGYIERNERFYSDQKWEGRSDVRNGTPVFNIEGGTDIELPLKWNLGVQYSFNNNTPSVENDNVDIVRPLGSSQIDSLIISKSIANNSIKKNNFHFHAIKQWGDNGRKMTFDADYLIYDRQYDENLTSYNTYSSEEEIQGSKYSLDKIETRDVDAFSSRLDFVFPFSNFTLNTGAKVSFTNTTNGIIYSHTDFEDTQNNSFEYKERIYALYVDYTGKLNDNLKLKIGLRMEHTNAESFSGYESKSTKIKHTRLFPTIYTQYKISDSHNLNFNLSSRISRPSNNMINPFLMYSNKYSANQGKADLQPSYTYNGEINYLFKNNLSLSAYASLIDNEYGQLLILNPNTNITLALWDNYLKSRIFGITNSYTWKIDWMQTYFQQGVNYRKTTSSSSVTEPEGRGWSYNATIRSTFYLNRSKSFSGTVSGSYTSSQHRSIKVYEPTYDVSLGLRYRMFNNKLTVSANLNSLLVSNHRGTQTSNNLTMKFNNSFSFTTVRFGVAYNFGADISNRKRNYSNSDIQQRL